MAISIQQPAALAFLLAVAAAISHVDWQRMIIPDRLNLLLSAGGLLISLLLPPVDLVASLAGILIGGIGLWLFRWGYRQMRGREGIGLGDVKFLAAAGAWTGVEGLAPLLLAASVAALGYAGMRALIGQPLKATDRLPFGPFLCLGLLIVAMPQILMGRSIYDLMLSDLFGGL